MNMPSILVTGVAGFIGSHLAKRLLPYFTVIGVDNLQKGTLENIPSSVVFIKDDLSSPSALLTALRPYQPFDAVFHLAGQSSGERSFDYPSLDLSSNLLSSLTVIELVNSLKIPLVVNASSMSVYGDSQSLATESLRPVPLSIYGHHKALAESYFESLCQARVVNIRMFNVYGPGQCLNDLKQGMVSIFLSMALKDRHIVVRGSLDRIRDFVYIDDVVSAWVRVLFLSQSLPQFITLNLGTGVPTSIRSLLALLQQVLPFDFTVSQADSTPFDQANIYSDTSRFHHYFPDFSFTALSRGLRLFANHCIKL